jgi:hypothetical protein
VLGAGREGEGVALFEGDLLPGDGDLQLAGQDEDELHVGWQRVGLVPAAAARLDVAEDGLHSFLAGRRKQVLRHLPAAEIDRRAVTAPDHLPDRGLEQGADGDVQCLAEPDERGHRDVREIPLKLGHESLGQPGLIGHLGHALAGGEPGRLQLRADRCAVRYRIRTAVPPAGAGHQSSSPILGRGPRGPLPIMKLQDYL